MTRRVHARFFKRAVLFFPAALLVGACSSLETYNPGDPASEEYYLHFLLRCALRTDGTCSALSGVTGTPSNQITPAEIGSNLKLWLEADVLSQADGTPVTSWTDQSSSGFNANQATGAQQPTYKVGVIGGKPAVRFNNATDPGTNLILGANYLFSANDGITMMAVIRSNAEDSSDDYVLDFGRQANDGYGLGYSANTDGSGNNARIYIPTSHGGLTFQSVHQAGTSDVVLLVGRIKFSPAADKHQSLYVNGNLIGTDTSHTVLQLSTSEIMENPLRAANSGPVTIGGQAKTGVEAGRFFDGDIALVLWFDKALTESERQGLECYAALKYSITVSHTCF